MYTCFITDRIETATKISFDILVKDEEGETMIPLTHEEVSKDFCNTNEEIENLLRDQIDLNPLTFIWE